MRRSGLLAGLALVTLTAAPAVRAQEPDAGPTIEDFAFMAGHWRGEGLGGTCEEVWSEPLAGTMVGSFRLIKDGEIEFYELMVLGPDADGWALKVKHFSKEFTSWEEKDEAVRFALEDVEGWRADFKGLKVVRAGDRLVVSVRFRSPDGSTRWEDFDMRAHPPQGQ